MEGGSKKQSRAANWDIVEKNYLVETIADYIKILECKSTDYLANKQKGEAWGTVYGLMCARYGRKRSLDELKGQWKRLKGSAKKEVRDNRRAVSLTGGGPPPPGVSPLSLLIKELLPSEFVSIVNRYDDDSELGNQDAVSVLQFLAGNTQRSTEAQDGCIGKTASTSSAPASTVFGVESKDSKDPRSPMRLHTSESNSSIRVVDAHNNGSKLSRPQMPLPTSASSSSCNLSDAGNNDGSQLPRHRVVPRTSSTSSNITADPPTDVGIKSSQQKRPNKRVGPKLGLQSSKIKPSETEILKFTEIEHKLRVANITKEHEQRMAILEVQMKTELLGYEIKKAEAEKLGLSLSEQ